MTTTRKAPDQPRYVVSHYPDIDQVAPANLSATPPQVEAAIHAAEKACAGFRLAATQARATAEEVKRAQAIDRAADEAAVAAGKPMPDKRATTVAVEAAALAQRRMEAARDHARSRLIEYATAVNRHRHTWLAEIDGVIGEQQTEARRLLAAFERVVDELQAERWVRSMVQEFPVQGALAVRGRPGEMAERVAAAAREEASAELQRTRDLGGNMSRFVDGGYQSLVAALGALIAADDPQP